MQPNCLPSAQSYTCSYNKRQKARFLAERHHFSGYRVVKVVQCAPVHSLHTQPVELRFKRKGLISVLQALHFHWSRYPRGPRQVEKWSLTEEGGRRQEEMQPSRNRSRKKRSKEKQGAMRWRGTNLSRNKHKIEVWGIYFNHHHNLLACGAIQSHYNLYFESGERRLFN